MTFQARFAENLIGLRKRAGLSREGLAIRASLSRDAIRKYERQVNVPTLDVVVRLGGALSVPPAELLVGIAYRPSFIGMGEGRYEIAVCPPPSERQTRDE
jgi:transcriptional regulator with XRE-family HTH domain